MKSGERPGINLINVSSHEESSRREVVAPTGVAQLVGCHPAKQKVAVRFLVGAQAWAANSVLCQSARKRQLVDVSLSLSFSLPFPLSKNK